MKVQIIQKFGGEDAEGYNVLATALIECGKDTGEKSDYPEYDFIAKTPRTSLVALLVDKIRELGYDIVKK